MESTLNTTAKINSVNVFTTNQTVLGVFKADDVIVLNTTPTSNEHLTSKLYVDTGLNGKQSTLIAGNNITITNNTISSTGGSSDITQEDLDLKEDKLSRNSHVNISSLIVSDDAFSINTIAPGQVKSDTLETGDITANSLILNATGGQLSLTANSLATF